MLWMEVMHAMLDLPRCHGPLHKESLPGMSLDCHHITLALLSRQRPERAPLVFESDQRTYYKPPARLPTTKYFPSPLL
jgi:hypothetical protein